MSQEVNIRQTSGNRLTTTEEQERVLTVHHWTDKYFSFTTTRDASLRFENGQFITLGLEIGGKLVRRAYSLASANWEEELEFFSNVYERFDTVVLVHGVRHIEDLAYKDVIEKQLPEHEYLGEAIKSKLIYAPVVSRDPFPRHGRITTLLESGELESSVGLPAIGQSIRPEHLARGSGPQNQAVGRIVRAALLERCRQPLTQ